MAAACRRCKAPQLSVGKIVSTQRWPVCDSTPQTPVAEEGSHTRCQG